jgi:hypothetical protein
MLPELVRSMRKVLLLLVGAAVLWVPAASVAGESSPSPSKPTPKADTPGAKSDVSNPASTCQSQRSELNFAASHSGQTFTQFYGTDGGNGRGVGANTFGKCVSTIANHKDKSDGEGGAKSHREDSDKSRRKEGTSPAMICKAMQAKALTHFQTMGMRPNAFGKCVAKQANSKKS